MGSRPKQLLCSLSVGENGKWLSDEKLQSSLKQIFKFTETVIQPNQERGEQMGESGFLTVRSGPLPWVPAGRGSNQGSSMFDERIGKCWR